MRYLINLFKSNFNVFYISVGLVLMTLPFNYGYNSVAIILMIICSIINVFNNPSQLKQIRFLGHKKYIFLVLLGVTYLLSIIWSIHSEATIKSLSVKIPLIIFPFVFAISPKVKKNDTKLVFGLFILSVLVVDFYCLINSYLHYSIYHDNSVFFYHKLSENANLNAIYLCAFNASSILFIVVGKVYKNEVLKWSILILLFLFVFLTASKMVVFSLITSVLVNSVFRHSKKRRNVIMFVVLIVLVAGIGSNTKVLKGRVLELINANFEMAWVNNDLSQLGVDGISIRVFQYRALFEIIQENPIRAFFGFGLKAHKVKLNEKYEKYNIYNVDDDFKGVKGLDFHNQYVCTFLSIGLFGSYFLIAFLISIISLAFRTNDKLMFVLSVFFALIFLTEMYLELQRGIILFATLLLFLIKRNEQGFSFN
ncbi:O-antigen ligase family protein [Aestuariivivens insulae]|uniref:O-antigen ligase family protein n=1 Tax=Aestuariivivens insulae TaxID=1621988 RepID=UPI001F57585D|nr:O-antigen ligase family protein [Aestuariivivens insulae]